MKPSDFPADIVREVGGQDQAMTPEEEDRLARLTAFSQLLVKSRAEAIAARVMTERRWLDDLNAYQCRERSTASPDMMETIQGQQTQQADKARPTRSKVFVGITRSKTNAPQAPLPALPFPLADRN